MELPFRNVKVDIRIAHKAPIVLATGMYPSMQSVALTYEKPTSLSQPRQHAISPGFACCDCSLYLELYGTLRKARIVGYAAQRVTFRGIQAKKNKNKIARNACGLPAT